MGAVGNSIGGYIPNCNPNPAQVVRRPVVAVGNSIGGYISASLAGDYPSLVQGLVLVNSRGAPGPRLCPCRA